MPSRSDDFCCSPRSARRCLIANEAISCVNRPAQVLRWKQVRDAQEVLEGFA